MGARSSPRNAMAYVRPARSSTPTRSDPRRQLEIGLAVGLDADRHQDEIAEGCVMRGVKADDPFGGIQALALERHPQPCQSSRQLASRVHLSLPSGKRKDLPFWEVLCGSGLDVRYAVLDFLPASYLLPIRSSITTMPRTTDRIA